ncbi:MAG: lamin tail domain-containing protein, partial [Verrucomicrobia bacterium]|nr:lamin tail domain-containing protein [Verrucomicrobiota bacterium]
ALHSLPRETIGPSTRRHGIVISEVMYHPTNRTDGRNLEYIELYNSQPWFQELGGWRISGAIDYTFPSNVVLQARSYFVVAANTVDFRSVYSFTNVHGPFLNTNGLQNSSGTLRIRNKADAVMFEMTYTGDPPYPAAADGGGHSLVLGRPSYGERDPRAWVASDLAGGNPGGPDTPITHVYRSLLINEVMAHTDPPQFDYIELHNRGTQAVNIGLCFLTDDPSTNKFQIASNTLINPGQFLSFSEQQLGFALSAAGETVFLKSPQNNRVIDAVRFPPQENGVPWGRSPDGATEFHRLNSPTPGTPNATRRPNQIVINEILFDPLNSESDMEFVELHNTTGMDISLAGWRLREGIIYTFPSNAVLRAGNYLTVARDPVVLRTHYPQLNTSNCWGGYNGSLANGGERIVLTMPDEVASTNTLGNWITNRIHIPVDEVAYGAGGRWSRWAAGGGSSLELRDARADNRLAPNWAASNESNRSGWVVVEATGVMDNGWAEATQLHVTLMGAGEAIVDDVEVIPSGGANLVANGNFNSGTSGWTFQGNHNQSQWTSSGGFGGSGGLHIVTQGKGDSGANRIRVQLSSVPAAGTTVTLRCRARWVKGNPNLLLRLRGNWHEAPGVLPTTYAFGTPAAANTRATVNAGPAITDVRHEPALPAGAQPVLVLARVHDPDGLAYLALHYRIDPQSTYRSVAMTNHGSGLFSTRIPAQAAGTTAAFFIQAIDNHPTSAQSSFPDDAPTREAVIRWGDPANPGTLPTYRMWITQTNVTRWSLEEKMSNRPKDVTFIYGNSRVIYNAGAWFHGSPYHSPSYNSPVGNSCDYDLGFPPDDALLGETDINLFRPGNGGGDGTAQAEIHGYWFGEQFGIPYLYHRPVFVLVNGQQRDNVFHDAQQPNGDFIDQWHPDDADGDLHKIMLGFEFGDMATGANEAGYSVIGSSFSRVTTTGGAWKQAWYRSVLPLRSASPSQQNNYTN